MQRQTRVHVISRVLVCCLLLPALAIWTAQGAEFDFTDGFDAARPPTGPTSTTALAEPLFEFAVVGDFTGGLHRPALIRGIEKLNLLRPQFVMSVGDLIEGGASHSENLDEQWTEMNGMLGRLDMPFFYVAGNHDILYQHMRLEWEKRFGRPYYSFNFHDCHFLVLCSEYPPDSKLNDEQLAWAEQDLKDHASAKWTFLFFHKIRWLWNVQAEVDRKKAGPVSEITAFRRIEEALEDRPFTIFVGHVHDYVLHRVEGGDVIGMAKLASADDDDLEAGTFKHIAWVRMRPEGPEIVNLLIDGVVAKDVIENPCGKDKIYLERGFLCQIEPFLPKSSTLAAGEVGEIRLHLWNLHASETVELQAEWKGAPDGFEFEADALEIRIEPEEKRTLAFPFKAGKDLGAKSLGGLRLQYRATYADRAPSPVVEREVAWPIAVPATTSAVPDGFQFDGLIEEWGELNDQAIPAQAELRFAFASDKDFVYGAFRVADDDPGIDDMLALMFDLRSPERRSLWPREPKLTLVKPSLDKNGSWEIQAPEGIQAAFRSVSGGMTGEVKVSLRQPHGTHFAFNARYKNGGDSRVFFRGIKKVHDPLGQTRRWKHYWLNE